MSQTTDSITVPAPAKVEKKCAIIGTAPTWVEAPWHDKSFDILTLNDGYLLAARKGWPSLPRITVHFDLHPFHQMAFAPGNRQKVHADEVPVGAYLRPQGHLEWLKSRPHPVFVGDKPADWPAMVQTFPRQAVEQYFGTTYFCSTPAWMLAWALMQGYTTIAGYGIHLATEWEYVEQRPNFEWWLATALNRGCQIILPQRCPLMRAKRVYAYEPKADLPLKALDLQIAKLKHEGATYQKQLAAAPWYAVGQKADLQTRLETVQLELTDLRQAQQRVQAMLAVA